jgi:hypothetical protein
MRANTSDARVWRAERRNLDKQLDLPEGSVTVNAVSVVDAVHLGVAFLIILCAVTLGWVQLGQRVMTTLIGVQVLVGIVYSVLLGGTLKKLGGHIAEHVAGALLAMGAYIAARRLGARSTSPIVPIVLAAVGLVLVLATAHLGLRMSGRMH